MKILSSLFALSCLAAADTPEKFSSGQTLDPQLAEFAQAPSAIGIDWLAIRLPPPPAAELELPRLLKLQQQRTPELQQRIESQEQLFGTTLEPDAAQKPQTRKLLELVDYELIVCVLGQKQTFDRARPSMVSTELNPSVAVPRSPSYPSEHSLRGHCFAYLLASLNPQKRQEYYALADDIAVNREHAGTQFASDSYVGELLARRAARELSRNRLFQAQYLAAAEEWGTKAEAISRLQLFAAEGFLQPNAK